MSRVPYRQSLAQIAIVDGIEGNEKPPITTDSHSTASSRLCARRTRPPPLLGHGIKGNRVIGADDEKQFAVPLDPQTLRPSKDRGIRERPEYIHESLREFAGIVHHSLSKKFLRGLWG